MTSTGDHSVTGDLLVEIALAVDDLAELDECDVDREAPRDAGVGAGTVGDRQRAGAARCDARAPGFARLEPNALVELGRVTERELSNPRVVDPGAGGAQQ